MEKKYFKYNQSDILEILTEALAVENGFGTFNSRSDLFIDNGEVFFVGVVGEVDDLEINDVDLDKLYSDLDYNGTHPKEAGISSKALCEILDKAIKTGDY